MGPTFPLPLPLPLPLTLDPNPDPNPNLNSNQVLEQWVVPETRAARAAYSAGPYREPQLASEGADESRSSIWDCEVDDYDETEEGLAAAAATAAADSPRAAAVGRCTPELVPRWDWSLPEGGRGLGHGSSAASGAPAQIATNSIFSITQVHAMVHGVVHGMVHYTEHDIPAWCTTTRRTARRTAPSTGW